MLKLASLATLALLPLGSIAQSSSASASGAATSGMTGSTGGASAYLTAVLGALTSANLTSLVSAAEAIANTTEGMSFLMQLGEGNKTVFAPSNDAFMNISSDVDLTNTTLVTEILSYHVLNNTYSAGGVATMPNHTIARSLLRGGMYMLPGNKSAPVVLAKNSSDASSFMIIEPMMNVSTMGPVSAANLQVYVIDSVLSLPLNLSAAATEFVPSLAGVIQQAQLLEPLEAASALTVFAPNDAAISAVMSAVGQLNTTQIQTVLANHVINGSAVYSTELMASNYTSAAGEPFRFMSNSTGTYVMSANSTAMIVKSDVILNNGVVHVIDGLLLNTGSNPAAAASAYSSAQAAASTMMDPTGPQTSPPSMTSGGGASGAATSGGADSRMQLISRGGMGSVLLGGLGAVIGGAWLLM